MIHKYSDALVILLPEICTKKTIKRKQALWHMPLIPALRRMRQEDGKFEVSLGEGEGKKKVGEKTIKTRTDFCDVYCCLFKQENNSHTHKYGYIK